MTTKPVTNEFHRDFKKDDKDVADKFQEYLARFGTNDHDAMMKVFGQLTKEGINIFSVRFTHEMTSDKPPNKYLRHEFFIKQGDTLRRAPVALLE